MQKRLSLIIPFLILTLISASCINGDSEIDCCDNCSNGIAPSKPTPIPLHTGTTCNEWEYPSRWASLRGDGRYAVHALDDEQGSLCLVDMETGHHRHLFTFLDEIPDEQKPRFPWEFSIPVFPDTLMWAGDDSCIYLWYGPEAGSMLFCVDLDGSAHIIDHPSIYSQGWFRGQQFLGSPAKTSDIIMLEATIAEPTVSESDHEYRLLLLDIDSGTTTVIDELEGRFQASGNNHVFIVASLNTDDHGRYPVRKYWQQGSDWVVETHSVYMYPAVRLDAFTSVEIVNDQYWMCEWIDGEMIPMFHLPANAYEYWSNDGRYLISSRRTDYIDTTDLCW